MNLARIAAEIDLACADLRELNNTMPNVETAIVSCNLSIAGCDFEQEATVRYVYTPFRRGYHEKCGGQIDPDEPEDAEILSVVVSCGKNDADITHLLNEDQFGAIVNDILEQRE